DNLSSDIIECMGTSSSEFIVNLFKHDVKYAEVLNKEESTKKKKKYSVSSEFKDQLVSLMDIVDLTDPHFIRCIKPNPQNEQDSYDRKSVTEQLRYGGVLQVVQVSRAGYPVRINHQECWDDYKIIAQPATVRSRRDSAGRAWRHQEHESHLNPTPHWKWFEVAREAPASWKAVINRATAAYGHWSKDQLKLTLWRQKIYDVEDDLARFYVPLDCYSEEQQWDHYGRDFAGQPA
ncbi:unnamed protein product, partial [Prorocentrum cordatum]